MNNRLHARLTLWLYASALALSASGAAAMKTPLTKTGPCPSSIPREKLLLTDIVYARFFTQDRTLAQQAAEMSPFKKDSTVQMPLDPDKSVNCTDVPTGLKVEMWASELDPGTIKSIQSFTFDERGRMWAVETFDYPNTVTGPFAGHDRIVILEDTDGDHIVDKEKVFVSGLNIPGGIEIVPQGVVIALSPHVVLFEDNNGDDVADSPQGKILYTGFNKYDTHMTATNVRYGLDNWLYMSCGYWGGKIKGVQFGSGLVRMRMDGSKFEVFAKQPGGGNTAAFGTMEDGQIFGAAATDGVNTHSLHAVIPGEFSNKIAADSTNKVKPITNDIIAGDKWSGFTSATSHELYTARLFPKEYWNRAAFVTEGTSHLVNVDFLDAVGSTWTAKRVLATPNLYASSDAWSCPLQVRVGPDGGMWILDWYTPVYLHNGANDPVSFGDGGGLITKYRDRSRERFYRVIPADGRLDPVLNLKNATQTDLVATLGNSNMLWRMLAQKQILKVTKTAADSASMEALLIKALSTSWAKDSVGIDGMAIHALWTAEGLGFLTAHPSLWDPILKAALLHPSPAVRMNVAKAMPRTAASAAAIRDQCLVNRPEPQVRLWGMLALAEMPVTSGITIYTTFHNLDTWSKQAFTKAQAGSGITDAATFPVCSALHAVENPVNLAKDQRRFPVQGDIKLNFLRNGNWDILPNAKLGTGSLIIYTLQGKAVAKSLFDGQNWSNSISGLSEPVYMYRFQNAQGDQLQGKIMGTTGL